MVYLYKNGEIKQVDTPFTAKQFFDIHAAMGLWRCYRLNGTYIAVDRFDGKTIDFIVGSSKNKIEKAMEGFEKCKK